MADTTSPSVRQRKLGTQLRELRNRQNLTVEDVTEELEWSATKLSWMETGLRCPTLRDVRDLCDLYTVSKPDCVKLMALAREAWERGWWTEYDDLVFDLFSGSGDAAVSGSFMMYYIPALLQTEEYARKIIDDVEPNMDADVFLRWVKSGMRYDHVHASSNRQYYSIARE